MPVDLAYAITISIPRPSAVAHGGVGGRTAVSALPLVRVQGGTIRQAVLGDQGLAGARIRALAAPEARLARVPRHHPDAGGTLVGGGPVSLPLIGTPAGRLIGRTSGAGHHSGRGGLVQVAWRRCRRVCRCVRDTPNSRARRAVGSPLAIPRRNRTSGPAVAGCSRRRSPSAACRPPRRPDSGRPQSALAHGTSAARGCRTGACEAVARQVALPPEGADAVIQEFGDGNVNHAPMIPHPARWLHMSRDRGCPSELCVGSSARRLGPGPAKAAASPRMVRRRAIRRYGGD